jgi:hypothetical protein
MSKKFDIEDVSTWYYYPILMPVDAEGRGPADYKDTVDMTYEVWDTLFVSYGNFESLTEAISEAIYLNKNFAP